MKDFAAEGPQRSGPPLRERQRKAFRARRGKQLQAEGPKATQTDKFKSQRCWLLNLVGAAGLEPAVRRL